MEINSRIRAGLVHVRDLQLVSIHALNIVEGIVGDLATPPADIPRCIGNRAEYIDRPVDGASGGRGLVGSLGVDPLGVAIVDHLGGDVT